MEISKSIERKYLHDMAIDQLVDEYSHQGYQVTREPLIGSHRADLIVSKDGETIIFEVKTTNMDTELRKKLAAFSEYVKHKPNHRFRVVFATPPQAKTIEVDNLEELLTAHFIHEETPDALLELSSNTLIEAVTGVSISRLTVSPVGRLDISGTGVIDVLLQYGGSDGFETADAYPFEFSAIMSHDGNSWQLAELSRYKVDTSSFYE